MKKRYIYILIGIISFALVGLVAIQLYWIDNAITLRNEEFGRSTIAAVDAVTAKLEKIETLDRVRIYHQRKNLYQQKMKQINSEFKDLEYDTTSVFEENGVKYKVTEKQQNNIFGATRYQRLIESVAPNGDVSVEVSLHEGVMPFFTQKSNDSIYQYRQQEKSLMVQEVMDELMDMKTKQHVLERINKRVLDSLLKVELKHRGIKAKFQYGIFDYEGNEVLVDSTDNIDQIRQSGYFAQLFPKDVLKKPHFLSLYFPHQKGYLLKTMGLMLLSSIFLMLIIVWSFIYIIQTIFKQKKLSEIKNDFISNMTHELKTPISTISLACEALNDKDVSDNETVKTRYVSIISEENKRLGVLVERVLKSATWNNEDLKLKKERLDLHQIISEVAANISIQITSKNGEIQQYLNAERFTVMGDKVHITNLVYNLLDNANKYAPKQPEITIETENIRKGVLLTISDNGIGIKKENLTKIFDKFYRVPTGNVHDVKGFGLGLNYVKAIVDRHDGEILCVSTYQKGSAFKVYLPFKENEN